MTTGRLVRVVRVCGGGGEVFVRGGGVGWRALVPVGELAAPPPHDAEPEAPPADPFVRALREAVRRDVDAHGVTVAGSRDCRLCHGTNPGPERSVALSRVDHVRDAYSEATVTICAACVVSLAASDHLRHCEVCAVDVRRGGRGWPGLTFGGGDGFVCSVCGPELVKLACADVGTRVVFARGVAS